MNRIAVVFNPNSKKNRRDPARFGRLEQIVQGVGEVVRTDHPEAVKGLVGDFLDAGVPYLVADGGDGAFHWLVNAVYLAVKERGRGERVPAIMPTNSGTIDFMGRKAGVIGRPESLLRTLVKLVRAGEHPEIVALDSLLVRGELGPTSSRPGERFGRLAFAVALAGIGQRFFERFYDQDQRNRWGVMRTVGRILGSASLSTPGIHLLPMPPGAREYGSHVFEPIELDVRIDREKLPFNRFRALNCGSIDINLAGLLRLFPYAREQGVMHVQAGNPRLFEVVKSLPVMFAGGRKLPIEEFIERPARHLEAVCTTDIAMNPILDGEYFEGLVRVEVRRGPQVDVIRLVAEEPR